MSTKDTRQNGRAGFRRGQSVTVRSLSEILATLDADGKLEGLPFMPEMVPPCGNTFRVHRRAERTCVEGVGIRSMQHALFLEGLRCDGSAHDGCQRGCLFFWKDAWLKPANEEGRAEDAGPQQNGQDTSRLATRKGDRFFCQSTELAAATGDLPPGTLRHYLHDLRIREMSLGRFGYILWRALANRAWRLLHGHSYYEVDGAQQQTRSAELSLQPGELVEIKSAAEIAATLDAKGRNRGLSFDPEMLLHCGRRFRVATPLHTIITEENGTIMHLNNTVLLEGLVCQGICALNCPRANYFYWREIWLIRVES